MRRFFNCLATLLLLVVLMGCNQKELIRKLTPEADDKMARQFIEYLRAGQLNEAEKMIDEGLQNSEGKHGLDELAAAFKRGEVKNAEVVGVHTSHRITAGGGKETAVKLSYQLELTSGWFAGFVIINEKGETKKIGSARFNSISTSLEDLNRFSFARRRALHFGFPLLCIAIPTFSIVTLVKCARSKIRHKWFWIIFILFGLVTFNLNWTTGEMDFQCISFLLFGAAAFKAGPFAPWILSFAIPIGAVVFIARRKQLLIKEPPKILA